MEKLIRLIFGSFLVLTWDHLGGKNWDLGFQGLARGFQKSSEWPGRVQSLALFQKVAKNCWREGSLFHLKKVKIFLGFTFQNFSEIFISENFRKKWKINYHFWWFFTLKNHKKVVINFSLFGGIFRIWNSENSWKGIFRIENSRNFQNSADRRQQFWRQNCQPAPPGGKNGAGGKKWRISGRARARAWPFLPPGGAGTGTRGASRREIP